MSQELYINVMPSEVRAALLKDGILIELVLERHRRASLVGNVYLGRVRRVMSGMEACFVDIGLSRAGFLGLDENRRNGASLGAPEAVHEGQAVLVQVVKDAIGGKGVQLTRRVTLPGRSVVYAPQQGRVMVSRQIEDADERSRLTALMGAIAEPGEGFIVRTASTGATEADLRADVGTVRDAWAGIEAARETAKPPLCLHTDIDPMLRVLRDNALGEIDAIHVDDSAALAQAKAFCAHAIPHLADRIELHTGPETLFERNGIEEEIERACGPRLDLPSGGGIVIQTTEALTSVDVNSGRFDGAGDLEQTALRTNLEAAQETARQLRLRNIGGLIVIDFIHMEDRAHWQQVERELRAITDTDRNTTRVLGTTAAGLIEVTRRRRREPLLQSITELCGTCGGEGRVRSVDTVVMDVLRAIKREARLSPPGPLVLYAAPEVVDSLQNGYADIVVDVGNASGRMVAIRAEASYGRESFDIVVER